MPPPFASALLLEGPANKHFAQLHRDPQTLTEAVTLYLRTGLQRGNGIIIIATPVHIELFLTRLRQESFDPGLYLKSGQLELHDAELTLRKYLRHDMPDWEDFRKAMGAVLERVRAFGHGTTRAYTEMVNVLWHEGKQNAAIRLEEYSNELARLYRFSLFCTYMLDMHKAETYSEPIEEIGRTHSDVVGTGEDEHFRLALDAASRDIFGAPLSQMVGYSQQGSPGGQRFPTGQRTMLWVQRNLPSASVALLDRARQYYEQSLRKC